MAKVEQFGMAKSESENYSLRKIDNKMLFLAVCEPEEEGAIQMTRIKDGNNHKAGDIYFMKGNNSINGYISFIAVRDGYPKNTAAKELVIGYSPDEEGGTRQFISLELVNEKHKINDTTRRLLPALLKADLGEKVRLAVAMFLNKAGDEIKDRNNKPTGNFYEKENYKTYITAYQEHLKSNDNPKGKIIVDHDEMFHQEKLVQKGRELVVLAEGERVPKDAIVTYDEGIAEQYARDVVDQIKARLPRNEKMEQAASKASESEQPPITDDDMRFGDDPDDSSPANRAPASRPRA